MNKVLAWRTIKITWVLLSILSFTPIVLSPSNYTPFVIGMPYSLGMGIIISGIFLILAVIGSVVAPKTEDTKEC